MVAVDKIDRERRRARRGRHVDRAHEVGRARRVELEDCVALVRDCRRGLIEDRVDGHRGAVPTPGDHDDTSDGKMPRDRLDTTQWTPPLLPLCRMRLFCTSMRGSA